MTVSTDPSAARPPAALWKRLAWTAGLALTGALSCAAIAFAADRLLR